MEPDTQVSLCSSPPSGTTWCPLGRRSAAVLKSPIINSTRRLRRPSTVKGKIIRKASCDNIMPYTSRQEILLYRYIAALQDGIGCPSTLHFSLIIGWTRSLQDPPAFSNPRLTHTEGNVEASKWGDRIQGHRRKSSLASSRQGWGMDPSSWRFLSQVSRNSNIFAY